MKILLVQHKKSVITSLSSIYERNDYETVVTDSFKNAIRLLESDVTIELALVDSELAQASTFELLKHIKNNLRLIRIPVILSCTECEANFSEQALKYGISDIIVLPCEDHILLEKTEKAIDKGKHTILIVDDDPIILNLLKYVIELERFRTLLAASAEEALDILSKNKVSAIISDIVLPGQSGLDLLIHIKETSSAIPVILITGNSDRVSPTQALSAGADGYIKKPFKNTEIIQTLRKLVKHT